MNPEAHLQAAVDALSDLSPGGARMVGSRCVYFAARLESAGLESWHI